MKINFAVSELKLTAGIPDQFPKDGIPQIAFSGRSNVGKSSLINSLLGRKKLARVSSSPGKTVTVNYYLADNKLYLVDLPGYGFSKRSAEDQKKWSGMTDAYFTKRRDGSLKGVVQLIDCKVGPTSDDLMMIDYMNRTKVDYLIVLSKSDKPNKTERNKTLEKVVSIVGKNIKIIPFSSNTGEGKDELQNAITSLAFTEMKG